MCICKLFIGLLAILPNIVSSNPIDETIPGNDIDSFQIQYIQNSTGEIQTLNVSTIVFHNFLHRLRQDEGLDAASGVAEIISGVLGGGLGNIFSGSASFIGDSAAQEEVQFVLNNISPVFEPIFKLSWEGLKQYFGIGVTTPMPMIVQPQQISPVQANQTKIVQVQNINQNYVRPRPISYVTSAPVKQPNQPLQIFPSLIMTMAPVTVGNNEDDNDMEAEASNALKN